MSCYITRIINGARFLSSVSAKKTLPFKAFAGSPRGSAGGCHRSRRDGFTTETQSARRGIEEVMVAQKNDASWLRFLGNAGPQFAPASKPEAPVAVPSLSF